MYLYKNYSKLGEVLIYTEGEEAPGVGTVGAGILLVHIIKYAIDRVQREAIPIQEVWVMYAEEEGTHIEVTLGMHGFVLAGVIHNS